MNDDRKSRFAEVVTSCGGVNKAAGALNVHRNTVRAVLAESPPSRVLKIVVPKWVADWAQSAPASAIAALTEAAPKED